MLIIGCDFHTRYQQIAMTDGATGELIERRLDHENREANRFHPGSSGCRGATDPAPSGRTGRRPGPVPKTPCTRPLQLMNCGSRSPLSLGITPALSLGVYG
jgi:hypothetical protein